MNLELVEQFDIQELIPHRAPVICVDALTGISEKGGRSSFAIPTNFIFLENQRISSAGLMENAAQTMAIRMGYVQKMKEERIKLGFIASFKNVEVFGYPQVGQMLTTDVFNLRQTLNMTTASVSTFCNERLVFSGEINVVVED